MNLNEVPLLRQAAANARRISAEQRRLVLAYPEIAERLTQPPMRYARPTQWTGYIPPSTDGETVGGDSRPNHSPFRAALLEILSAAAERYDADHPTRQEQPPAADDCPF